MGKLKVLIIAIFIVGCSRVVDKNGTETTAIVVDGEITSISGERKISGIYPHLTTYSHARENGVYGFGNECGIGAMVVWNNKLYMVNYAAHEPDGSEHKLYIVDENKNMEVFQGSIGGTPAARMIHKESEQLLIGPYVIDKSGTIKVIPIKDMKGRLTAIARHLKDPENMVYYYDMEGMLYEVNVYTLKVNKLYHDPLPGWHGKGAYTSQGKLVLANNGDHDTKNKYEVPSDWKLLVPTRDPENDFGILAEYDGENFKLVERRQYTDVTTKHGINAINNDQSPLWSMGWDKGSIRLKVLDNGQWHTFLLPKAAYNNDPSHGWFTEWPRIRAIGEDKMMMDMHGMFYDFPSTFSATNTAGIKPMGSHLRYIPDFLKWGEQIVLATDETSIQGNPLAGQPQSNLWFGNVEELSNWGPASAYGAIWLDESVQANQPSLPFLISGFANRMVHLSNSGNQPVSITIQVDRNGDNTWSDLETIELDKLGYQYYMFDSALKAEWVRLVSNNPSTLTAAFHFTDDNLKSGNEGKTLFEAIADIDSGEPVSHSKLYSNKNNFNLSVYPGKIENGGFVPEDGYEFTKYDFNFVKGIKDTLSLEALRDKKVFEEVVTPNKEHGLWTEDEASVILHTQTYNLRLPKGSPHYKTKLPAKTTRIAREVESERELANICGTFYELPLYKVDKEPLYKMMRPVSTHNKQITEFNTWNGLLVMSGIKLSAEASTHVYKSDDNKVTLWFGGIDDIWSFGKPVGEGGPWKNTLVKANELSDMYLMTGYDHKEVHLEADTDTEFELYIHINHYSKEPVLYKTFKLKAGEKITHQFPDGFSAHWAQLKSSNNCKATAWFVYK